MDLKCVVIFSVLASISSKSFDGPTKDHYFLMSKLCKASYHGQNWNKSPCVKKIADLIFQNCKERHRCAKTRKSLESFIAICTRKHYNKEWTAFRQLCHYVEGANDNNELSWHKAHCATTEAPIDKIKLWTEEFQKCQAKSG